MFRNGVSFPRCLSQMSPPSCQPVLGALARAVPTSSPGEPAAGQQSTLSETVFCGPLPVDEQWRTRTGQRLPNPVSQAVDCRAPGGSLAGCTQHFWISVYGGPCWGLVCTRSGAGCPARPCMRQQPFQVLGSGWGDKGVQNAGEACKLLVNLW